ncbi:BPI fold-containing family B member 4, partial [Merops nubicus]
MTMLKLFGIIIFCGLLWPSQGVLSGLSCAVSPAAVQNVLLNAIVRSGLLHQQVQSLVLPNIMSEGGLLNSPTIITGLHLVKIRVPDLSVTLSGIGVQINIAAKLELSGNCLVGLLSELINILVDVRIAANIKCTNFESGTVQVVVEDCLCVIGGMKIKVLSGLLSLSVNAAVLSHLKGTLPGLLCPVLDIVLNIVNIQLLSTLNVVIPVGTVGTIHYQLASLPFTAGSFLGLDLDGVVKQVGGGIIPHDSSPSALPPLLDKLMVLGVGESFLTAGVSLLLQVPARTFACTPAVASAWPVCGVLVATTTCPPFPQCSACGGTSPLSLKLTLSGSPLILLEENKATVKLSVLIHVFIKRADGSILSILLLRADLSLNARLSLSGVRLVLGLSLGRISLFLESSDVGITDVSTLKPHCSSLLGEMFLPLANAALRPGIPLPKVLDIPLVKVEIRL